MQITETTKTETGTIESVKSVIDGHVITYFCGNDDSVIDRTDKRRIWRGESIDFQDVSDRCDISGTPLWAGVCELRDWINHQNDMVKEAKDTNDNVPETPKGGALPFGYCKKCGTCCYGDCDAN